MRQYLLIVFMCAVSAATAQTSGGPDQFGYTWRNHLDTAGPVFNWIDIDTLPGTVTVTGLFDDNIVGPFNMPISFQYYGHIPSTFRIGSNGYISFASNASTLASPFPAIPTMTFLNNYLAVMACDLTFVDNNNLPLPGASCKYWSNASGDTMVISFLNVPFWEPLPPFYAGLNSFQVILCAANNSIVYQYLIQNGLAATGPANFLSSGIENQFGNTGLQVYYDVYPQALSAIRFSSVDINAIEGTVFMDWNSNAVQDTNDYGINLLQVEEQSTGQFIYTDIDGAYRVPVLTSGTFTVPAPTISNSYYTVTPPTRSVLFTGLNQTSLLNDFAVQPNQTINDLSVNIVPITPFRPGFNALYGITCFNRGTTIISPQIYLYPDSALDFITASIAPDFIYADSVIWLQAPLNPMQSRSFTVTVNVDSTILINSLINSGVKAEPVSGDYTPVDNLGFWEVFTTGSMDPNDILVNRNTLFTTEFPSPPCLEYVIRFQNTGNDTAFNVKVLNPIADELDITTFELVSTSAPVTFKYYNAIRLAEFRFNNILLPDSNINEPMSHGFIHYRVKPLSSLTAGAVIRDSAAIYFDFNTAVITNTALTEVIFPSGIIAPGKDFQINTQPNPVIDKFSIAFVLDKPSKVKMELLDITGHPTGNSYEEYFPPGSNEFVFSVSHLPTGIYLLKFSCGEMVTYKRLVKVR